MVGAINAPDTGNTFDAYLAAARAASGDVGVSVYSTCYRRDSEMFGCNSKALVL